MIISNLPIDLGRVKQNYSTDNENRPLLMSGVAGVSSTSDRGSNESVVNNSIYANPSTGTIHANISGNVTGSSGSCTGNAASATKLQTTRTINGTNFDGSGNITTDKWGTARNISISDGTNTSTAVSVNGSKAYSLNLPSTIKATFVGNITGNVTGNADSATKLQTARTINGTSFDGTANITTANWGTARNISITDGTNTGSAVSVNGSGNVTLKLPSTINADITGNCSGTAGGVAWTNVSGRPTAVSQFTNDSGFITSSGSCNYANCSGYVQGDKSTGLYVESVKYSKALVTTNQTNFGAIFNAPTKNYRVACATYPNNDDTLLFYSVTNANVSSSTNSVNKSMTWDCGTGILTATGFSGSLTGNVTGNCSGSSGSCTGNAATATALQTARSINGTNFNGSGNITTANWGTARNISIQDHNAGHTGSAVSVNGSGNVTLKLPSTIHADIDFPITEAEIDAIFNGNS